MFTTKVIAVCFVTMLAAIGPFTFFEKRGLDTAAKAILVIALLASLYCIAAGIFLLTDWQDPFATTAPQQLAKASATHGGRGGIVVLAIRFWPYVLIGSGGYFAYNSFDMIRLMRRDA
jgi:L-asparagine transporter-like permease